MGWQTRKRFAAVTRALIVTAGLTACGDDATAEVDAAPMCSTLCGDMCVSFENDIHNCGSCGEECGGDHPFCDRGSCGSFLCSRETPCTGTDHCCGQVCCDDAELCCLTDGFPFPTAGCIDPAEFGGTCPPYAN